MLTSIKSIKTMYLNETMYTEKIEKQSTSGNRITEMCCYTLKGGGYLVTTKVKESVEKDWGTDYKTVEETAYACEKMPELSTKEDELAKLKKFAESLNKY